MPHAVLSGRGDEELVLDVRERGRERERERDRERGRGRERGERERERECLMCTMAKCRMQTFN